MYLLSITYHHLHKAKSLNFVGKLAFWAILDPIMSLLTSINKLNLLIYTLGPIKRPTIKRHFQESRLI